jgi:hypothetical protein
MQCLPGPAQVPHSVLALACVQGWDEFDALAAPYAYSFNSPGFSRNCRGVQMYPGQYQTDVIAQKANDYMQ